MTLTILSAGFFFLSSGTAQAGFKTPRVTAKGADVSFQQYPKLGEVKADVNMAMSLHQTAVSLLSEKKQLEEYKDSIEKYYEIERRLDANKECNRNLMNEYFKNGSEVWKKASAYAEDTSSVLLAKASDSMGDAEASSQLSSLEKKMDAGDSSDDGTITSSASDSPYANFNENTTKEQADAMVSAKSADANAQVNNASADEMDIDEAAAFGKIRWDVGYAVLKSIYSSPEKWGTLKKKFTPWIDQKRAYDVYLDKRYEEFEKNFTFNPLTPFPARPTMEANESYMPEDCYNEAVPEIKATTVKYNEKKASQDDKWCGQTDGMKNQCPRVNKGKLYERHMEYVEKMKKFPGVGSKDIEPPYLPQKPLPPWRESVYIMNVAKELPEIASNLPDPWYMVAKDADFYTPAGELANLVERHGKTIRYRPGDYNKETGEIKKDSKGMPKLPMPLTVNRISSYLALISAKEEQEPIKDRAIASIKEMNENILSTLSKAGYTVDKPDFDLAKEEDYKLAIQKLTELQNAKISSAYVKMEGLKSSFSGKLLPSVVKVLGEETVTMKALQQDYNFLINVTRENAKEINSLLMTAAADATANENYKENLSGKMEELSPIPAVGCPVL